MSEKSIDFRVFYLSFHYVSVLLVLNHQVRQCESGGISEVDLSAPPMLVCDCAYQGDGSECRDNFQDWLIIRDGFFQNFTHNESFTLHKNETQNCSDANFENFACVMPKLKNVVFLGTGNRSKLYNILDHKERLVFCPNSIHPALVYLRINNAVDIYISPETIMERETSLHLEIKNVEGNLIFPIGFYDYNYKILDENNGRSQGKDVRKEPVVFLIDLQNVQNVKIESNCIATDGVMLSVVHASSLVIEASAVFDLLPRLSGISLKHIGRVEIHSTWSSYLIVDSCNSVTLYTRSICDSVRQLTFSNLHVFETREYSFIHNRFSLLSISTVRRWIPFSNSLVSNFSYFDARNKDGTEQSQVILKNVTVYVTGKTSIRLKCDKLTIESTQFFKYSMNFANKLPQTLSIESGDKNGNHGGKPEGYLNPHLTNPSSMSNYSLITVLFIASSLQIDEQIPNWVDICLLNDSITCPIDRQNQKCPFGFPYNYEDEDFKQKGCYESIIIDIWTVLYKCSLIFGGGFAAFIMLLLVYAAVRWRNRKLYNWNPDQLDMSCMSSASSRLSNLPQLIHVPPTDSQISFTLPKRFGDRTSPSRSETLLAVNLYYGEVQDTTEEDISNLKEKSSSPVELVRVNLLEDKEQPDNEIWIMNRISDFNSSELQKHLFE